MISGSTDEIAEGLAGYDGWVSAISSSTLWPRTLTAVEKLGAAAALAKRHLGS
ncbi:MAG: hypothetical protein ACRDWA_16940 [Acidimicrobiia bacterium]